MTASFPVVGIAALVDERGLDVEVAREALHPLRAARVGRAEHVGAAIHHAADRIGDDAGAVEVMRDVAVAEVELDAVGVQIEEIRPGCQPRKAGWPR